MNTNKTQNTIQDLVYIGIFAAIIAVCSWIYIPLTVPFTLQTMGIFTAIGVLGGKRGSLSVFVYILLGMMGVPVFSGMQGGVGVLFGKTGGYIIGFLLAALAMWAMEKAFGNKKYTLPISMLIGLLICYAFGTAWFMVVTASAANAASLLTVLGWCVFPFIIPDLVKIALALFLSKRLKKVIRR